MARDFEDHCWKDIVDEEILEIYEPYRREVRIGRNPAVLAIVGHLLHPVDGLSVKRLRDGNVGHCSKGRSAVPMLLTSENPDDGARLKIW